MRRPTLRDLLAFGSLTTLACGSDGSGRYTQSSVKASIDPANHVAVDIVYTNDGGDSFSGSRCVYVEWQSGTVLTQAEARAQKTSTATVVDFVRWCLGGNSTLEDGKSDEFHLTSAKLATDLRGTTIVVYADQYKNTAEDDRTMRPSP